MFVCNSSINCNCNLMRNTKIVSRTNTGHLRVSSKK